jgi:hypothetical protein
MTHRRLPKCLFILFACGLLIGCETAVDPFVGEERPFTIWGLMNAGADTQRVRVFPIADEPGIDRSGSIDAAVSSIDLTTGERREWVHREITYEDGGVGRQEDYEKVRQAYINHCLVTARAPDIALTRVEFHFIAADSAWHPPGGLFDPEVLVELGAFSNVENGYGFFGAGEVVAIRWTPPELLRTHLGYGYSRPCRNDPSPIQSCMEPPVPCLGDDPTGLWDVYF